MQADVAKAADVRRLFAETKRAFGGLDILVNNAGVFKFEPVEAVTEAEFHREFDTNVLGSILAVQEGLKYFGSAGGSIINVSSVASSNPAPNSVVYSATKAALDSVTRVLATELGAATSASTRSTPASPRPRARTTPASSPASGGSSC